MATVLIVEDEPQLRSLYRMALEHSGYTVLEAEDGAEALEIARAQPVSLVLADVVMPRIGGRELVWRLSEMLPGVPVILVSGMLDSEHMEHEDVQPAAYLTKPIAPSEIVRTVDAMLRG
jgi:two-component system, cell cycle sensor histidine kinase and response regulator CckA